MKMKELKPGLKFRSKSMFGLISVKGINADTNSLDVKVDPQQDGVPPWTENGWNLQHTLWGFENGEYYED